MNGQGELKDPKCHYLHKSKVWGRWKENKTKETIKPIVSEV